MKTNLKFLLSCASVCLGVILFVAGCASGPTISYEADREAKFAGYKTYALFPMDKAKGIQGADPSVSLRYAPVINRAIAEGLQAKGFNPVELGTADFSVYVNATIAPRVELDEWGYSSLGYYRWGGYWGRPGIGYTTTTVDTYKEGLLRVEVYDGASKELAWVGWAKDRLGKAPTDEQVANVIAQVLANFPPPEKPE